MPPRPPKLPIYEPSYLEILLRIAERGPKNLSALSRELKVPKRTLHSRVNKLKERGLLKVSVMPSLKKLGLIDVYVLIDVKPSSSKLVREALKSIDYWLRYYEIVGKYNGFFFHYLMPVNNVIDLEEYLRELKERSLAVNYEVNVLTGRVHYLLRPYGVSELEEVLRANPSDYSLVADKYDIIILSKLQEDAFVKLSEIAREVGKSKSLIKYHYDVHVRSRLIKGYEVITPRADPVSSVRALIKVSFKEEGHIINYLKSLKGKPFVLDVGKEIDSNSAFTIIEVGLSDLRNAISVVTGGFSEECWVSLLLGREHRKSLPLNLFYEGGWLYPKDIYTSKLNELTEGYK